MPSKYVSVKLEILKYLAGQRAFSAIDEES